MTKNIVAIALSTLLLSVSFAQAAQVNVPSPNLPINRAISLACSAGHGDVAQTVYITNSTNATIPAGTKIHWVLNGQKGTITLSAPLGVGKTVSDLANPGNGGPCTASFTK